MPLLAPIETTSGLSAELSFYGRSNSTPISLVKPIGKNLDDRSGNYEEHKVLIHDGRPPVDQFNPDREGFASMCQGADITNFMPPKRSQRNTIKRWRTSLERPRAPLK